MPPLPNYICQPVIPGKSPVAYERDAPSRKSFFDLSIMGPGSHPHVAYLGEFRLISELAFPLGHWVRPFRKLRLSEVSRWLDHLSSCSPCFQEFAEMRKEAVTQRRLTRLWLAFAVALIFAGGGWLWMRTRPSAQPPDTAVLDLRGISATRGESAGRSASSGNPSLVQTSDHGHCRSVARKEPTSSP